MKQPPSIQPTPTPGPDFDPMDRIIEAMENIESFQDRLVMDPQDLKYLNTHLSGILALRRTIAQELDLLIEEPYYYSYEKLTKLHQENERIFTFLEHVVGTLDPWNEGAFKKAVKALEEALLKFDDELTP
ncbi:MAG TPA: hypothetical protein VHA52_12820 [Candidatus Babeliaceae bacterium]|nr:hypothetical protein [Candidatus Babeliaceae bacterium]